MLSLSNYFIKEHVSFMKLSDTYEIIDPASGNKVGHARESISAAMKLLRFFLGDYKMFMPTRVDVTDINDTVLFSIKKNWLWKVSVLDRNGNQIGCFAKKRLAFGNFFDIFDGGGSKIGTVKGDWKGWNFKIIGENDGEMGTITKKWAGIGKELFTSADNYMISINDDRPDLERSMVLLAAGLAIDTVYKE
ncbi:MAG: phospholipid scramblase-related protein [bacterium]|nr:phospholipid scramblase-related protein [bacterium]